MKLSKNGNKLYLAECDNPGSFSNCNLKVLSGLGTGNAKFSFSVKIQGKLKEFDVLGDDKVIVLTNDNKI